MTPRAAPWFAAWHGLLVGLSFGAQLAGAEWSSTPTSEDHYFFDSWSEADGLELNSVTAIEQTRDGYLWLGTYNGLMRFDGVRFVVFSSGNTPELPNRRITALFEDDAGTLWIGHETGELTRRQQGKFQSVTLGFKWVGGPVSAISADEQGDVWLGSGSGGLFRLRDGHCSLEHLPDLGWPIHLSRDAAGRLWVVSNGTTGRIVGGVFQVLTLDETGQHTNNYSRLLPARDPGWWVIRNEQIGKWVADRWQWPLQPVPWWGDFATSLLETPSGWLLVGTMRSGLFLLRAGQPAARFTRAEGILSDRVRCLFEDREGNLWLGTGKGLNAMRTKKVEMLSPPDHWGGHTVLSFWTRADGSAWVGTQGAGLYHYDPRATGTPWTKFDESQGLRNLFIWSVLETRHGELLAGSWGAGLFGLRDGRFTSPPASGQLPSAVLALYESAAGELWIGTQSGLARYTAGRLEWVARKAELGVPDVRAIIETPDGALWFGMAGGGLAVFRQGALRQFRQADGLASDFVNCLYAEPDGTLWIGTADSGLSRLKQGSFATIGLAQGLPNETITHVADDGRGYFWLGSHRGILRASKTDLDRCADGQMRTASFLSYGKAEGLTSQTCPGGFQPGACLTPGGRLWFPTAKGIAVVDPAKVTRNTVVPPVVIEEFVVDGQPVETALANEAQPATRVLEIPAGRQRFEFRYAGLSFTAPERVRFKYRLAGLEEDWIEAGTRRVVQYTHLPPGAFTFRVLACNSDEVWNETGAAVAFTVLPYFWQTWWFQTAAVAAVAAAVGGGVLLAVRRRVRRKLAQMEQQRAVERERSRIARDIHDDLGASLTRITMLSQTVRRELGGDSPGAQAARQVCQTARELTRAMDEIVWAVNPRHDTLDSLATYLGGFAQDFLEAAGIRCRLDVPVQLPPMALTAELRHSLFLALKEALHNVVKHSGATEVEIALRPSARGLDLTVRDNGHGWNGHLSQPAVVSAGEASRRTGGNGTLNMKSRLEQLGGDCHWETTAGTGTRVCFSIPVKSRVGLQPVAKS